MNVATQAEVVRLKGEGKSPAEIAEITGIKVNGVYGHLRRAGVSMNTKRGRPRGASARAADRTAGPAVLEGVPLIVPSAMTAVPLIDKIKAELGDVIENTESQIQVRHQEIEALQAQRTGFANALNALR